MPSEESRLKLAPQFTLAPELLTPLRRNTPGSHWRHAPASLGATSSAEMANLRLVSYCVSDPVGCESWRLVRLFP